MLAYIYFGAKLSKLLEVARYAQICENSKTSEKLHSVVFSVGPFVVQRNIKSSCRSKYKRNIARGTTDPEIDSVTWIKFINNMAHLH